MSFADLLNLSLVVSGFVGTGNDTWNQPVGSYTTKGTVPGRIDAKDNPDEVNGPDLNPVISEYLAITALPSGFTITERDTLTGADGIYEVLGIAQRDGRVNPHHLEVNLRKITA